MKLTGSEKQITWAENIRTNLFNDIDSRINWEVTYRGSRDTQQAILYRIAKASTEKLFDSFTSASQVIDHRDTLTIQSVDSFVRQMDTLITNGKLTIEQIAARQGIKEY